MSKLFHCLSAVLLGAAIALPTPALAFRGGGGFHGGFGGFHGGFGGFHSGFGGFHGGMIAGRSVFVPGGARFITGPFVGHGHRFVGFRRFGVGVPFYTGLGWPYYYGDDYGGCYQRVWTTYGWQWAYLC